LCAILLFYVILSAAKDLARKRVPIGNGLVFAAEPQVAASVRTAKVTTIICWLE